MQGLTVCAAFRPTRLEALGPLCEPGGLFIELLLVGRQLVLRGLHSFLGGGALALRGTIRDREA